MPLKRRTGYRMEYQPDVAGLPAGAFVGLRERDTFNCCHCRRSVVMNPGRGTENGGRPRNLCHKCDLYTCDAPFCIKECNPMEESIELALKYPHLDIGFVARGEQGEALFDNELFRPVKSYRQRPREV